MYSNHLKPAIMFGFKHKTEDKTFKEVQEYLGNIKYINAGGCGIAALAMYRWLKKNNQSKNTSFMFLDNEWMMFQNNKKCLETNNGTPGSCGHVVLLHGNKFIDCYGNYYNVEKFSYRLRILSEDFLVNAINNISTWNTDFNRKKEISKISKHLHIDLSDIKSVRYDLSFYLKIRI